jgi:hypothetical protein
MSLVLQLCHAMIYKYSKSVLFIALFKNHPTYLTILTKILCQKGASLQTFSFKNNADCLTTVLCHKLINKYSRFHVDIFHSLKLFYLIHNFGKNCKLVYPMSSYCTFLWYASIQNFIKGLYTISVMFNLFVCFGF